jgi:hypothetical protein
VNVIPVTNEGKIILAKQTQPGEKPFIGALGGSIDEGETPTGQSIQSWIASSVPLDDSVREIREIVVRVRRAPKGNEGAIMKLEKLTKQNEPRVQKSN